jgi:PAS domain S-box-containing protein
MNQSGDERRPGRTKTRAKEDKRLATPFQEPFAVFVLLLDQKNKIVGLGQALAGRIRNLGLETVLGMDLAALLPEEALEGWKRLSADPRSAGEFDVERRRPEWRVWRIHSEPLVDQARKEVVRAVCVHDLTEQRRGERDRFRLASAIEQAGEAFVIVDKDFTIRFVNQTFEEMTGYPQHEARGQPIALIYRGGEQERALRRILAVLRRGEAWTGRTGNARKDGSTFECQKTIAPIRGKGGLIEGYISVWRDVTEVDGLERQVRQAQKMEALGTLAGGIAHDFNNILGPIILHAQMGLTRHSEDDPSQKAFEQILEAAERAQGLVRQILHLSRQHETGTPVLFRLDQIVGECLALLRPSLPSTIRIAREAGAGENALLADPAQVHQVVMNLCTNAAQSMPEGGDLAIRTEPLRLTRTSRLRFAPAPPGDYVCLTVADSGQGMAPETMARMFEPFFTTKPGRMGTGLGLTVVHNIVVRLGGAIRAESEPGRGTVFQVLFPQAADAQPGEGSSCLCLIRGQGERVLLVDDDPRILDSGKLTLERLGYLVVRCGGGREALDVYRTNPERFDLVLSNVTMPGLAGPALARAILDLRPGQPIILFTGDEGFIAAHDPGTLGVSGFLRKPFHLEELSQTVRRALLGAGTPQPL